MDEPTVAKEMQNSSKEHESSVLITTCVAGSAENKSACNSRVLKSNFRKKMEPSHAATLEHSAPWKGHLIGAL